MRRYLKKLIVSAMLWTGIIRLLQFIHRNEIVIWTIHGVMDDEDNPPWKPLRRQLSRSKLEQYLQVLSKRYDFVSLQDAVDMLKGQKPMQPYSMVLTFDDGYHNNITHALPILRRYNAPATFFISTGYPGNPRPFWFDRLDYALQHAAVDGREANIGGLTVHLDGSSREALSESFGRLRSNAKKQNMSDMFFLWDIDQLAGELEIESDQALSDLHNEDDWSAVMTWDEIEENVADDVTFGSHTVDHIRLDLVEESITEDQLLRSKRDIELHTGEPCQAICFPNGNVSDRAVELAKACSYRCGLTTVPGLNRVGDDVMLLRRIHMPTSESSAGLLFYLVAGWS